jgi:hypothetical protein
MLKSSRQIVPSVRRIHSSSRTDTTSWHGCPWKSLRPSSKCRRETPVGPQCPFATRYSSDGSEEVPAAFHARFHSVGKQYRYYVWNSSAMNPCCAIRPGMCCVPKLESHAAGSSPVPWQT